MLRKQASMRRANPGPSHQGEVSRSARSAVRCSTSSQAALEQLQDRSNIDLLVVPYPGLVTEPARWVRELQRFVGRERLPMGTECAAAIDSLLYRQRSASNGAH